MDNETIVERVARAIRDAQGCGLTVEGCRVFCDDNRSQVAGTCDCFPAARAAIAAYESEAWRPISEAPKDGTRILVWATTKPPHYEDQAYIETVLKGKHVEQVQPAAWIEEDQDWELHYIGTPLFWMPLPAPPAIRRLKDEDRE